MSLLKNWFDSWNHIPYTTKHKIAYLKVEKQLRGKNTLLGFLHDSDKLLMYAFLPFLGTKKIGKIHRENAKHHVGNNKKTDYHAAVIDWECARFTKQDKPWNAQNTLTKFYPEYKEQITPILIEFGLISKLDK